MNTVPLTLENVEAKKMVTIFNQNQGYVHLTTADRMRPERRMRANEKIKRTLNEANLT